MTDQATLAARLAEAEQALHDLSIGRQVVQVRTGTDAVQYAPADRERLEAQIASLKAQLGTARRPRAIGVRFR